MTRSDDSIATRKSWPNLRRMPKRHTTIPLDLHLDAQQAARVRQGFIPAAQEEKWFAYFEKNTLYQHRSWSGILIDQVHFVEEGDGLRATHAEVNRYTRHYENKDDEEDQQRITDMVRQLAELPDGAKSKATDPMIAGLAQALQPNYLGSPKVIRSVVAPYVDTLIGVWRSRFDQTPPIVTYDDQNKAFSTLLTILSGNNPDYTTMPWHSVEQLGQAVIKYMDLNAEYCEGETLDFILGEGIAAFGLEINYVLQTFLYSEGNDWSRDVAPRLAQLLHFFEAVLLGTNSMFFPGVRLKDLHADAAASSM